MRMKCLKRSILRGDTVKVGEVLDLTEEECKLDVVKAFFVAVDADAAAVVPATVAAVPASSAAKPLVAGLTRDQVIMKLNQAGVKVKGNASNAVLVDIYNQTFANLAEATK